MTDWTWRLVYVERLRCGISADTSLWTIEQNDHRMRRVILAWSVLLLAATVQSFVHMPHGLFWLQQYDMFILWNPALSCYFRATFICNSINLPCNWAREVFKSSRCSKSSRLYLKKLECFGFFVGDVISGVGLDEFISLWAPTVRANFLISFYGKLGYTVIQVFWAFAWLSNISGLKVVAK